MNVFYFFVPVDVKQMVVPVGFYVGKTTVYHTFSDLNEKFIAGYVVNNPRYQEKGEPSVDAVRREYVKINIIGNVVIFALVFLINFFVILYPWQKKANS